MQREHWKTETKGRPELIDRQLPAWYYSGDSRAGSRRPTNHADAAGVQRRLQKLVMRSAQRKTSLPPSVDLTQFLHSGWHPPGASSSHRHCGGMDLVHEPQVSQHGHALAVACSPIPCPVQQPNARAMMSYADLPSGGGEGDSKMRVILIRTFAFGEGQSCEDGEDGHRDEQHLGLHGCFSFARISGELLYLFGTSSIVRAWAICMMLMGWDWRPFYRS